MNQNQVRYCLISKLEDDSNGNYNYDIHYNITNAATKIDHNTSDGNHGVFNIDKVDSSSILENIQKYQVFELQNNLIDSPQNENSEE